MFASSHDLEPLAAKTSRVETILVVDDDETFRKGIVRQLDVAGFNAIEAPDGSAAIQVFVERGKEISAVLLDLVMPGTSGGATLAMLRYHAPTLPAVIISGYSALDAHTVTGAERDVGFLGKPFAASQLIAELRRVIDGQRPHGRHAAPPRRPC